MAKTIPLTQGYVAIVDDADHYEYGWLNWFASGAHRKWVYAARQDVIDGKKTLVFLHRLIAKAASDEKVDHINGDTLDNRRSNLRFYVGSQNHQNRHASNGSSQFKGVCRHKQLGKWQAQIRLNRRARYLGVFASEADAARAYDAAARQLFGEFAATNFGGDGEQSG